jgi:hypothetical protein
MIWDIDLIFGMWVYNHKLQINIEIHLLFLKPITEGIKKGWNICERGHSCRSDTSSFMKQYFVRLPISFYNRIVKDFLGQVRVRWAIVTTERPSFVVRPSVNFSHFNQLLWSHWANLNQTLVEWSLDGPLPKLCPVIPTSNQDGRQAKNRKKGGWNFDCSLLL